MGEAWVVVPARGGSVGVPRKNLRMLAGKPLIRHVIDTALEILPATHIVIVTDDSEIAAVTQEAGVVVVLETMPTPSNETLDTKVLRNLPKLRELGARDGDVILTVQPTSPLLKAMTLRNAINTFDNAAVKSVLTVVADQHLRWVPDSEGTIVPAFAARVNRQQLPVEYRETGGVIAARIEHIENAGTRVIEPVSVIPLTEDEAVDIDTYSDLYAAAHLLSRKRIAIRVDASQRLGMGHVYRMLALASELARHDVTIYLGEDATLGQKFFADYPYASQIVANETEFVSRLGELQPDLVVLDILDTESSMITNIREAAPNCKVISFEDQGDGATDVDLLIAEFVDNLNVTGVHKLAGIEFALLSPSFEIGTVTAASSVQHVREILVLFGGTDPSGLAERTLGSLNRAGFTGKVTVARGLGAEPIATIPDQVIYELEILENVKNMPVLMSRADVAYTSAGRTVIELLARGTPAICMAQNEKELTHTHAIDSNGVLHLGLGKSVSDDALDAATMSMLNDAALRQEYAQRAKKAGARRSNRKTISTILAKLGFEDFPDI